MNTWVENIDVRIEEEIQTASCREFGWLGNIECRCRPRICTDINE